MSKSIRETLQELDKILEADNVTELEQLRKELTAKYPQEPKEGFITTTEDETLVTVDLSTGQMSFGVNGTQVTKDILLDEQKFIKLIQQDENIPDVPCHLIFRASDRQYGQHFIIGTFTLAFNEAELGDNQIVSFSGGRGYQGTYLKSIKDKVEGLITKHCGQAVKSYDLVKNLPQGDLYFAKIGSYDKAKAFLIKDGKVKSASISTLVDIIKNL